MATPKCAPCASNLVLMIPGMITFLPSENPNRACSTSIVLNSSTNMLIVGFIFVNIAITSLRSSSQSQRFSPRLPPLSVANGFGKQGNCKSAGIIYSPSTTSILHPFATFSPTDSASSFCLNLSIHATISPGV